MSAGAGVSAVCPRPSRDRTRRHELHPPRGQAGLHHHSARASAEPTAPPWRVWACPIYGPGGHVIRHGARRPSRRQLIGVCKRRAPSKDGLFVGGGRVHRLLRQQSAGPRRRRRSTRCWRHLRALAAVQQILGPPEGTTSTLVIRRSMLDQRAWRSPRAAEVAPQQPGTGSEAACCSR